MIARPQHAVAGPIAAEEAAHAALSSRVAINVTAHGVGCINRSMVKLRFGHVPTQ